MSIVESPIRGINEIDETWNAIGAENQKRKEVNINRTECLCENLIYTCQQVNRNVYAFLALVHG